MVGFAATAGVSPPVLLQAAGIDPALLTGPDAYLLLTQEQRLWHEAARLTGDPDFGLHLAEWAVPRMEEQFDVLAFAVRSCATLGEHYRRAGPLPAPHPRRHLLVADGGVRPGAAGDRPSP